MKHAQLLHFGDLLLCTRVQREIVKEERGHNYDGHNQWWDSNVL